MKVWDKSTIQSIHCFGDSLTFGYGVPLGQGWVGIADRAMPGLELYNHGRSGSDVQDIFDDMTMFLVRPEKTEGFFFMGGTNDILTGHKLDRLERDVAERLAVVAGEVPLSIGIPLLATKQSIQTGWEAEWNFDANQKDLTAYGEFLQKLAEKLGTPVLDFSKAFPLDDAWYFDGVHPNAKGYEAMADVAEQVWGK